ncbi:cytochrome P450 4c3 [Trichonephila clavipes]|nr:cytochrome P450 4c3 [Trichonephila clavipes]
MLGIYPEIQRKVHQEIDDVLGDDEDRQITLDDIKNLKYLDCVLKESRRLWPPTPFIARDLDEDVVIDGCLIPKGTSCGILIFMLHRDPDVFPNPEKFDPNRFLLENSTGRHPFAYIPFSAGPRNCIGQRFAVFEAVTVMATILRKFKVKSLDPIDRIHTIDELVLRSDQPLRMTFEPRKLSINKVASSEFQSTVQQIYRWKEEDFRVVKIEAELILEANRLQLMKQDLEKAENAYLSSFTSKKSKTLPGATAAAHGDPNGKNDYQKKSGKQSPRECHSKRRGRKIKTSIELLHMDLCGPMPTESQGGNKYFLSIIDDYSRKVTVFPIRNKSDVFHTFIRFQKRAERFLSRKVIAVRTDGGLEFCNKDMDNFLTELGIKHEVTNSYTPEMNGVAERFNLTALDGIKTLLKSSEVPHKFWGEALLCFTYAWNRICHKDSNKTPFEKYSGRKPSVLHLKPFGCLAYADENKLVETINVRFDENKRGINFRQKVNSNLGYNLNLPDYYDDEDDFDRVKDSLTSRLVSKTSTEMPSTSEKPDVSSDNHSLIPCTEVKWIRNIGRKVTGSNVYYSIEGEATRLKSFNEIERYCKRHNIEYDPSLFNFRKDNTESQGFSDLSEQQEALMVEVTIPNGYKQAIRSRDASKWHDAMDKEINVMMERKVWD